ncbi:MAG: phosphatase PAP2 family protein [Armatimonadota bacterium]|nr:MAG: phosphatase PAP2 family protein [Armatimonadota bacterium]
MIALAIAFLTDGAVMNALASLRNSSLAEFLGNTVRWLGTGYVQVAALLLLIAVSALFRLPSLRPGAWALLSFLVSGAAVTILKVLVHRPRPWTEASPAGWSDYLRNSDFHSFPSGETTTTFAIAFVLGWAYPRWRAPLLGIAAVVAAARVVVGSHHPSDVLAGAILGMAVAQLLARMASRSRRQESPAQT